MPSSSLIFFDWNSQTAGSAGNMREYGARYFPISREKSAPEALSEYINHSSTKAGATIMVISEEDRSEIKYITNKFYLSSMQMSFSEKAQLTETFGTASISFFNDTVKVYNFAGRTVDYTTDEEGKEASSMQQSSLTQLYDRHLRGTKLVQNRQIALIKVFNHIVYGYPINFNVTYTSQMDKVASFAFQFVVVKHTQNLPGLFEDEDLEKNYSVAEVVLNESDAHRIAIIEMFLKAYDTSLKLTHNDDLEPYLDIGSFFSGLGSLSLGEIENLLISVIPSGAVLSETQSQIRRGIHAFIRYLDGAREDFTSLAGTNYNIMSENYLRDLSNGSVDNMFFTPEAKNETINFLSGVLRLKTRFEVIKRELTFNG